MGNICTQECFEDCPPGWECLGITGFGLDLVFLCVMEGKNACSPCDADDDCPGAACIEVDGTNRCIYACGQGGSCPESFLCQKVAADDATIALCLPKSGSCECTWDKEGETRPCEATNDFGACPGLETCDPEAGWSQCDAAEPAEELCDGQDNDCDGTVDDGLAKYSPCESSIEGVGTCKGNATCGGAAGWLCNAAEPAVEVCDYQDNDCSGIIDDSFQTGGKYVHPEHCGSCGVGCAGAIPNAEAFCNGDLPIPQCVVATCAEGYYKANSYQCLPVGQTQCKPCFGDAQCGGGTCVSLKEGAFCVESCTADECGDFAQCLEVEGKAGKWCLPLSQDCSCTDLNAGTVRACSTTNDAGTCFGQETCDPAVGWTGCTAATASAEVCDGQDNDCDAVADDGLTLGEPCEFSDPEAGTCGGQLLCLGAAGWICNAAIPKAEVCDYADNDCDGEVDEDFMTEGKYTSLNHCGSCAEDCEGGFPNADAFCDVSAEPPACKVESCLPGYYKLNDTQCIEAPDFQCAPCNKDEDCYFDVCAPVPAGKHCLRPCPNGDECKEGYACSAVEGFASLCLPTSGSCDCNAANDGMEMACSSKNDLGTCFGLQTCEGDKGWSECTAKQAAAEECNGSDDDCDSQVDEGLPLAQECAETNEFGNCPGQSTCQGAAGWVCNAPLPEAETCDGKDNNCDGSADEPFKADGKYTGAEHCGTCNNSCSDQFDNASGKCEAGEGWPHCVVDQCAEGYVQVSPYECIVPPDTSCQPCATDKDCFGAQCTPVDGQKRCIRKCLAEEDCAAEMDCLEQAGMGNVCWPMSGSCECNSLTAGEKKACSASNEKGACFGFQTCDPATGWSACDAVPPADEECNGLDDDCDVQIDEGLPPAQPCEKSNQWGKCAGLSLCAGALGRSCQAPEPAEDVCDYLDNDCDGITDGPFVQQGKYATNAHCGLCNNDCSDAIPHATAKCEAAYPIPKCVVVSCEAGYVKVGPFQCVLPPDTTCFSCTSDADCLGGFCVALDGEKRCAKPCLADADCAAEKKCLPMPLAGSVCVPVTGSCTCDSTTQGLERPCFEKNGLGTCYGMQTCDPVAGWSKCSATPAAVETCNGLDDNCNGQYDEGLPPFEECQKANAFGTCKGMSTCAGGQGWVCNAAEPAAEVCDYIDNDCDGTVDEPFAVGGKYTDFHHCGACTNDCEGALANADIFCDVAANPPVCKVQACKPGFYKASDFLCIDPPDVQCKPCAANGDCFLGACLPLGAGKYCFDKCPAGVCPAGYQCKEVLGSGPVCLPIAGSCDCTPANNGAKRACASQNPLGTCYGFETCVAGSGWQGCTAPQPAAELCDGLDNDCNGAVDDGLPDFELCSSENAFGKCDGLSFCVGAQGWVCQAPIPTQEACDYLDNDCDGIVDDGFVAGGKYTGNDNCGKCGKTCVEAIANGTAVCDGLMDPPKCVVESCDPGYYKASPFQCAPMPDTTCDACVTDAECQGALCVTLDGQKRCVAPCQADADCIGQYLCLPLDGIGDVCRPKSGSCECIVETAGTKRSCKSANQFGSCFGFQVCNPETGWSPCDAPQAAAEECNGQDDNCNGLADDGLPATKPCEKTNAFGICKGDAACYGGAGWVCNAATPAAETCDLKDNDCDGGIDENYKNGDGVYNHLEACGACGISCSSGFLNGVGKCDPSGVAPKCVVDQCKPGYFKASDTECLPDSSALCEACAVDADCAATVFKCISFDGEQFCSKTCAQDADCPAAYQCILADAVKRCIPDTLSCDCDGTNLNLSKVCTETWPPGVPENEADTVCYGLRPCSLTGWGPCMLPAELCDALDNNCDGQADEAFMEGGKYVADTNCGMCGNDCTKLPYPNVVGACNPALPVPECMIIDCLAGFFDANEEILDGCECEYVGPLDNPDGIDQNCDGVDGEADNAIFVSENGSDANPGTIEQPLKTLPVAMQQAAAAGKRDIYVSAGNYPGSLSLVAGAKLYGGYSQDFHLRDSLLFGSTIIGDAFDVLKPGALTAVGITGQAASTIVDGFTIKAAPATTPGGSTYAVYLRDCTSALVLARNHVVGATGNAGTPGLQGTLGIPGVPGTPGTAALATPSNTCSTPTISFGGAGGTFACAAVDVSGGKGGDSACPSYEKGPSASENGLPGKGPSPGAAGLAGWDGKIHHPSCKFCTFPGDEIVEGETGLDGAPGENGLSGAGCNATAGQVIQGFWAPAAGSKGGDGKSGSGGGGGGSGGGGDSDMKQCVDVAGGTGGGGGSGGCSGTGGLSGTGGGGSFGIFIVFTTPPASLPSLQKNMVIGGQGGSGGQGGTGGQGGSGGQGAPGGAAGAGEVYCSFGGGAGGYGGGGGHGGGGGGGCGGVSYCLYAVAPPGVNLAGYKAPANMCFPGAPGTGGLGGVSPGIAGQKGQPGLFGEANF
jgi:hypothetical protein